MKANKGTFPREDEKEWWRFRHGIPHNENVRCIFNELINVFKVFSIVRAHGRIKFEKMGRRKLKNSYNGNLFIEVQHVVLRSMIKSNILCDFE